MNLNDLYEMRDPRDAYQRDVDNSQAGMGKKSRADVTGEQEPSGVFAVVIDGRPWKTGSSNEMFGIAERVANKYPDKKVAVKWPTGQLNVIKPGMAEGWKGALAGGLAGAALGSVAPGFGTIPMAALGAYAGHKMGDEGFKDPDAEYKKAQKLKQQQNKGVTESDEYSAVTGAITRRIITQHPEVLATYGPAIVSHAIDEIADFVGDVDEIGSSDVSGWVSQVIRSLGRFAPVRDEDVAEGSDDLRTNVLNVLNTILQGAIDGEEMIDIVADELGDYFQDVKRSKDKTLRQAYQFMRQEGAEAEDNPEMMAQVAKQAIDMLSHQGVAEGSLVEFSEKPEDVPGSDDYEDLLFHLAYEIWDDDGQADQAKRKLNLLGWKPEPGDDYTAIVLYKIGGNNHRQYKIDDFEEYGQQGVAEGHTEVKDKEGKVVSWKDDSEWHRAEKNKQGQPKDPRGVVTHLSDVARRKTAAQQGVSEAEVDSDGYSMDHADSGEYDYEGDQAKDQLNTIVRAARKLNGLLDDNENMPEWVQMKITNAADYIDTAADYIESNQEPELEEGNRKPEPPEADYGDDYQQMVLRLKKLAGAGPLKTVYHPASRVYRNVPVAVQPKK